MGVTVRYKGMSDGPTLVAGEGEYPSLRQGPSAGPEPKPPGSLYLSGNPSELRQSLRAGEQTRVLEEVYRQAEALSRQVAEMPRPQGDNLIASKTAVSSQPRAITATPDQYAATPARHDIQVYHPAQGQTILSEPKNPVAEVELEDGEHSFTFTVDGEEHELTVEVNNDDDGVDTQEEFLQRLSRAVNMTDSRISARVAHGEEDAYDPAPRTQPMNRTVRLEITSTQEGRGVGFRLADVDDGTLIQDYGLDAAPPPRENLLRLEGGLRRQDSNQLSLDGGHLTAQVEDATQGSAQLQVTTGPEAFTGAVSEVISGYNRLVRYLDANADILRPSLKDRLVRPLEARAGQMPQLGLKPTPQGRLEISESFATRLTADYQDAVSVLTGDNGWAGELKKKLDQVLAMEPDSFAADLSRPNAYQQSQEAWQLVGALKVNIIDGYY